MENLECMISIESLDSKESYKAEVHNDPDKNCLFYKEEDKTITTFDYENNVLTRENEKMKLVYKFILNEKTITNILIKDIDKEVSMEVLTKKIEKTKDYIEIVYEIEDTIFTYKIVKE